jgi:hypothetical protein
MSRPCPCIISAIIDVHSFDGIPCARIKKPRAGKQAFVGRSLLSFRGGNEDGRLINHCKISQSSVSKKEDHYEQTIGSSRTSDLSTRMRSWVRRRDSVISRGIHADVGTAT